MTKEQKFDSAWKQVVGLNHATSATHKDKR
jgi:hypothetical protein